MATLLLQLYAALRKRKEDMSCCAPYTISSTSCMVELCRSPDQCTARCVLRNGFCHDTTVLYGAHATSLTQRAGYDTLCTTAVVEYSLFGKTFSEWGASRVALLLKTTLRSIQTLPPPNFPSSSAHILTPNIPSHYLIASNAPPTRGRGKLVQVLGSVTEAAGLVAPRNTRIVHAITGTETAIPIAPGAGAGAVTAAAYESTGGGPDGGGRERVSGSTGGGRSGTGAGGAAAAAAISRDQVPLFRY